VQHYGIRALGELLTVDGHCQCARNNGFRASYLYIREIKFLELIARWSMSEFERNRLLKAQDTNKAVVTSEIPSRIVSEVRIIPTTPTDPLSTIKLELLAQLTQELRTPLTTSVLGMAGVVSREIYGP